MNSIILVGRLTRNPDIKYIGENRIPVANFTLAVDRNNKKDSKYKTADFINIQAWREATDISINKLKKGSLVSITGSLRIDEFTNKEGKKQYITRVNTSNIQLLQHSSKIINSPDIFEDTSNIDIDKIALPF